MTATFRQADPLEHPDIPSFDRMLEVVGGLDSWSAAELKAKRAVPAWHVHEAQAHLALAMLQTTPESAEDNLQDALHAVERLPSIAARGAACAYLGTFLSDDLRQRFDRLARGRLARMHRRKVIAVSISGAAAAAAVVAVGWYGLFRRSLTSPSAVRGEIALLTQTVTLKGGDEFYTGDKIEYTAAVQTPRRNAWLIGLDDERAFVRDYAVNQGGPLSLSVKMTLDARECVEFFIVIVADEMALPLPSGKLREPTELPWLSAESATLQALAGNGSDQERVQRQVINAARKAGISQEIEVFVFGVKHHRATRPGTP